jgi:hypothetical protein
MARKKARPYGFDTIRLVAVDAVRREIFANK